MNGSNERKRSKLQARGSRVATRGEFPCGPMVRTYLGLSLQWLGSIPDWGTKIPQAKWCSQKRKGLTRFKEVELTISGEEEAPMENFRRERGLQKLENCL